MLNTGEMGMKAVFPSLKGWKTMLPSGSEFEVFRPVGGKSNPYLERALAAAEWKWGKLLAWCCTGAVVWRS